MDVGLNLVNKLGHNKGSTIARTEELSLQASEEAFTCGIILRDRCGRGAALRCQRWSLQLRQA